jgi:hypothetical protein
VVEVVEENLQMEKMEDLVEVEHLKVAVEPLVVQELLDKEILEQMDMVHMKVVEVVVLDKQEVHLKVEMDYLHL